MQRLPTNVCMVLPVASEKSSLDELTALADKIVEVALPSIATVSATSTTMSEVEHLRAENESLRKRISALQTATGPRRRRSCSRNSGRT